MSLPVMIPVPAMPLHEHIEKIQRGISDTAAMCSALGDFLAAAFPHAAGQAGNLEYWLEIYLNHNNKEYLENLRKPQPPMPPGFGPFDPLEHLAKLCKQRDNLQLQLDSFYSVVKKLEDKMDGEFSEMLKAQLGMTGLPQQLEDLNEQISNFQRQMESTGDGA
jgi:hypothetical protein